MSGQDELVPWLRRLIESDLTRWRDREAHFRAVREREGDYDYFEARERVAQLEAELAVLDEHGPFDPASDWLRDFCRACGELDHRRVSFPCRTVRLLGRGYRFRPGYREAEWKP